MESFETKIQRLDSELTSAQNQLGDHYEYAGDLSSKVEVIEEVLDTQTARITTLEERPWKVSAPQKNQLTAYVMDSWCLVASSETLSGRESGALTCLSKNRI